MEPLDVHDASKQDDDNTMIVDSISISREQYLAKKQMEAQIQFHKLVIYAVSVHFKPQVETLAQSIVGHLREQSAQEYTDVGQYTVCSVLDAYKSDPVVTTTTTTLDAHWMRTAHAISVSVEKAAYLALLSCLKKKRPNT